MNNQVTQALEDSMSCVSAAIEFAISNDSPKEFLNAWLHGDWDVIRCEWPEAPGSVFPAAAPSAAEPVASNLIDKNQLVTEFCWKWSGYQKVEAGDVLDWIMSQPVTAPQAAPIERKFLGRDGHPRVCEDGFGPPASKPMRAVEMAGAAAKEHMKFFNGLLASAAVMERRITQITGKKPV